MKSIFDSTRRLSLIGGTAVDVWASKSRYKAPTKPTAAKAELESKVRSEMLSIVTAMGSRLIATAPPALPASAVGLVEEMELLRNVQWVNEKLPMVLILR